MSSPRAPSERNFERTASQMFRVAFLERSGSREQRLEERLVADELRSRGIPIQFYTQKQIDRRTLPLGPDTFIMGAMPAMHVAMKQLQIPIPQPNDYPEPLRPFLHRRIWRSTLKELEQQIWRGLARPVFGLPRNASLQLEAETLERF